MTLLSIHPSLREPLLLTAGSRPASVAYRGGEVNILAHDEWYAARRTRMLADLRALHPDTAKFNENRRAVSDTPKNFGDVRFKLTGRTFAYATRVLEIWEAEQKRWYAVFGLTPPRHANQRVPTGNMIGLWTNLTNKGGDYKPPLKTARARSRWARFVFDKEK